MNLKTFEDGWRHFWGTFDQTSSLAAMLGFLSGLAVLLTPAILVDLIAAILRGTVTP